LKDVHPENIRNVAFIAHQSAGKTTLCESILHRTKSITRMGEIEDGNTVSDYQSDEISRHMSITTSLLVASYKDTKLNILDTPGFTDFSGEVISAVRVADFAGVLIHASAGIEVGTELVWSFVADQKIPAFFYVNHLDKENVNFDQVSIDLEKRFKSVAIVQFPVNPGSENFNQIIDLIEMKLVTFNPEGSEKSRSDIPDNLSANAKELRQKLVDAVAETDDDLMEKFFENDGLTKDELTLGLRNGFNNGSLYPLLCGAAKRQVGTSTLLEFLQNIAPSPLDRPNQMAVKEGGSDTESLDSSVDASTSSLVFKTVSDKNVGDLSYFRVFSGMMKSGEDLRNTTRGSNEKIGQIYTVTGKNRTAVDIVPSGDMGALVKLKDTHTSNSLSSSKEGRTLLGIDFPNPVTRIAIEAKQQGDEEKISNGLHVLAEEDPSFKFKYEAELSQLIISGQGELHLNILIDRLKNRFGVEVDQITPKIPYRETIKGSAEGQGKYKKQSGGRGQYGDCWLKLEKLKRGEDYEFVDAIVGGVIPGKFVPAVEKGVKSAIETGVIAGFPVVDIKVTCYDGSYHTVDSSENAFKMAGSMAFKKTFKDCKPMILEPIEDLEVRVPEEFMGDVMGDISSKRGKIMGMENQGSFQLIRAKIPLSELYLYSSTLRSITGGRGLHKSSFSHYEEVPIEIKSELTADYEARRAEGIS